MNEILELGDALPLLPAKPTAAKRNSIVLTVLGTTLIVMCVAVIIIVQDKKEKEKREDGKSL